jgi:hypothetical protein
MVEEVPLGDFYQSHARSFVMNVPIPGRPFIGVNAPKLAFDHLWKYHGVDPVTASNRLHKPYALGGLGPADDVAIGRTGDVYNAKTGQWLGTLTDKSLRKVIAMSSVNRPNKKYRHGLWIGNLSATDKIGVGGRRHPPWEKIPVTVEVLCQLPGSEDVEFKTANSNSAREEFKRCVAGARGFKRNATAPKHTNAGAYQR